jgi:putative transposase
MPLHRNSQKRYYIENAIYFITTKTYGGYPYFIDDIFCELFVEELLFCQKLKRFEIYGYKINPDHVHLLIMPNEYNYSEIIHNLKRTSSLHINQIIGGEDIYPRLQWTQNLNKYRTQFIEKYGENHNFPPFKWQKSFHDHIIRNKRDFRNHITYIQRQWLKHGLRKNKWCYVYGNEIAE